MNYISWITALYQEYVLWIFSDNLWLICSFLLKEFFKFSPRICFERERAAGREGEKNIDVREKHQSVAFHTYPNWGSNPQCSYVPWPGIKLSTFQCSGQHSVRAVHFSNGIFLWWAEVFNIDQIYQPFSLLRLFLSVSKNPMPVTKLWRYSPNAVF